MNRCGRGELGVMDIYGAEFDWIKMWVLNVITGMITYTCARTAAKVQIQVRKQNTMRVMKFYSCNRGETDIPLRVAIRLMERFSITKIKQFGSTDRKIVLFLNVSSTCV